MKLWYLIEIITSFKISLNIKAQTIFSNYLRSSFRLINVNCLLDTFA